MKPEFKHSAILQQLREQLPSSLSPRTLLVGGAVRDLYLTNNYFDLDLLCIAGDAELVGYGFHRVAGRSSGAVYVRNLQSVGRVEITSIENLELLPDELKRRDFTINALAIDLDGRLYDPLGGMADLALRRLRPCSPTVFDDDPARIFRAFRFLADSWIFSDEILRLLSDGKLLNGVERLPVERFSREMVKALVAREPLRFFEALSRYPQTAYFLPEIIRMSAIPAGPPHHHPEGDLFSHSGQVLVRMSQYSELAIARFCAFFHDLGKLQTNPEYYPRHNGHESAGAVRAEELSDRLKLPRTFREALRSACQLHGQVNRWNELRPATHLKVVIQAIKGGIVDFLPDLSLADKPRSESLVGWHDAVRVALLSLDALHVNRERLMALDAKQRGEYIWQRRVALLTSLRI